MLDVNVPQDSPIQGTLLHHSAVQEITSHNFLNKLNGK